MARKCKVTNTGPLISKRRSHAMNANPKKWHVNLQSATVIIDGKPKKTKISARALRTMKHKGTIIV